MDIQLDNPDLIPESISQDLDRHRSTLESENYLENMVSFHAIPQSTRYEMDALTSRSLRGLVARLEEYIHQNKLLSYHCTREPESGFFETIGVRVLDREAHQREFLSNYGHFFTDVELAAIQTAWQDYFADADQDKGRNGRIWFCLSPYLVINNGTEYFFDYYGGEAIHKPLHRLTSVMEKLSRIGNPVVVETRLDPNELRAFNPFAIDILSHYHRRINPSAHIYSVEGKMLRDIRPDEIIRVIPKDEFFAAHRPRWTNS